MDALSLRRLLVQASDTWSARFQEALALSEAGGSSRWIFTRVRPPRRPCPGDAMAASYAYTLAAVLKVIEELHGVGAADDIAAVANEILENGDFDDWNRDLRLEPGGDTT